jgi:hypothetical protein
LASFAAGALGGILTPASMFLAQAAKRLHDFLRPQTRTPDSLTLTALRNSRCTSDDTLATYRVAAFQTFLSGRI